MLAMRPSGAYNILLFSLHFQERSAPLNIFHSVAELAGNTPLLELCRYERRHGLNARILAKLECCNVAGSAKDRVAKHMIERAEAEGKLVPGSVIIEPTSGNTGIGLAAMAKVHGYRVILTGDPDFALTRMLQDGAVPDCIVIDAEMLGEPALEAFNRLATGDALMVDAILYNRAQFAQPFPLLELRFADLNGQLIASSRFRPSEYLSGELAGQDEMPPQTPIHISLEIKDPGAKAVNYSLSFHSPE